MHVDLAVVWAIQRVCIYVHACLGAEYFRQQLAHFLGRKNEAYLQCSAHRCL